MTGVRRDHRIIPTCERSSVRDIVFVLEEWLQVQRLDQSSLYSGFDGDSVRMLLEEGEKFCREVVAPTGAEGDRVGCRMVHGRVVMPECMREPYVRAFELGWPSLTYSREHGGQGAPHTVGVAFRENLIGANISLAGLFGMNSGVVGLLDSFGTPEQKRKYIPKLVAGRFGGTGCISEPHAGSDVAAATTSAEPVGDGRYRIKGTKCWISGGDENFSDNIIHTVLARIKGGPSGSRGLSLFLVPAAHVGDDGEVSGPNGVTVTSIEDKMGLRASPTCVINFGDDDSCYGELLGSADGGMGQMFQSMNEARLMVALMGLGGASRAYRDALSYARTRVQGAHITRQRQRGAPPVPIIEHPDVRLNLLGMKARVEAMRALLYATYDLLDHARVTGDPGEREDTLAQAQILTPMCKAWCTEVGLDVARTGIQVLGGVGYTKDFPLEQTYRDIRATTIFEGTTGIQGLDLLGRKIPMRDGIPFRSLLDRFGAFANQHAGHPLLGPPVQAWAKSLERMSSRLADLEVMGTERGPEGGFLYGTPCLMFCAAVTAAYYFLQQGVVAADRLEEISRAQGTTMTRLMAPETPDPEALFYVNKVRTVRFFVDVVLPTFEAPALAVSTRNYDPLDVVF